MRRLTGGEADCPFCGEQQSNVAGPVWRQPDGGLRSLVVCLDCGTSNARRIGRAEDVQSEAG
ncbi:hypothetical protein [Kitasatospora sp. NPDC051914]|uniref:hypothetical protein n=1 Tax=Kitasatospora sp. NPDC051914 TaxID=3154945 RepID=UPI00344897B5